MAIEDYIPNVFGKAPTGYEGLLGVDRTKSLQSTANLQGLLGAASALAQGMSAQGPRRSALQNILSAVTSGFQGSQGAYQQGLQQFTQQQQLGIQQRQLAGAEQLKLKYPELAQLIDTNLPGAMRIIGDMEQEKRQPKLTSAKPGETIIDSAGNVIFRADADRKKNTAVVGNTIVDLDTGLPVYTSPAEAPKPVVVGSNLVDPVTGNLVFSAPKEQKAPEIRDFADGTTRQYDPTTQSFKIVARKPTGEGKTMYESKATVDDNGKLVFLPTRPGLPVVDAATGKPVNYQAPTVTKQLPTTIQKAEDEDYDLGRTAINLAKDADKYLGIIKSGAIKFGPINRLSTTVGSMFGSESPDVTARNDFEAFKNRLINESLRLNKGVQTDNDAKRATKELMAADSMAGAAKAIATLRDINSRAARDAKGSISRRRKNAKLGDPEVMLEIPNFEPHVFSDSDYKGLKSGTTFVDPNGVRRVKP